MPARKGKRGRQSKSRWSGEVTRRSDALDLEEGVFKKDSSRAIALSLRRSAERSTRRKASPYQSAMSMLTFYLNRAGRNLNASQKRRLEGAKQELRKLYGKDKKEATSDGRQRGRSRSKKK